MLSMGGLIALPPGVQVRYWERPKVEAAGSRGVDGQGPVGEIVEIDTLAALRSPDWAITTTHIGRSNALIAAVRLFGSIRPEVPRV